MCHVHYRDIISDRSNYKFLLTWLPTNSNLNEELFVWGTLHESLIRIIIVL